MNQNYQDIFVKFSAILNAAEGRQDLLESVLRELKILFPASQRQTIALQIDKQLIACFYAPSDYSTLDFELATVALKTFQTQKLPIVVDHKNDNTALADDSENYLALCTPLYFKQQPLGVLYLDTGDSGQFLTTEDAGALEVIANLIAPQLKLLEETALDKIPSVFISYVREDREWVNRLSNDLRKRRIKVWYDRLLEVGENWSHLIRESLKANDAFVLVMSPTSMASEYVLSELEQALSLQKKVFPLMYQRCAMPAIISEIQYLNIGREYQAGLDEIARVLYFSPETTPYPNYLPTPTTSFVGRTKELAQIKSLLETDRLVTLTGPGGTGKTRLGLEAARQLLSVYTGRIWMISLEAIFEPELVTPTVARRVTGQEKLEGLVDYLKDKKCLLFLDNCEHLLEACARLAEQLLKLCPQLQLIATSRENLSIMGESVLPVPSLSLPETQRLPEAEKLADYEAVALFAERARAVNPKWTISSDNARPVVEICRQLDGIPLALELAAARLRMMSVEQIATRLHDRFRLLTGGSRAGLPRQQTLRALIEWSYDLLDIEEKILLERLAVFAGGWTLEAAELVCSGGLLEDYQVLDYLMQLISKSLVVVEDERDWSETRYRMLETIRQYALERAQQSEETSLPVLRENHLNWMSNLAEQAEPQLFGPEQTRWLTRLDVELDNLRVAIDWCNSNPKNLLAGLTMAGELWRFWFIRGYFVEGYRRLEDLLSQPALALVRTTPEQAEYSIKMAVAKALNAAGILASAVGNNQKAAALYEEALNLFRELDAKTDLAIALGGLGRLIAARGDMSRGKVMLEESLAIARQNNANWPSAVALTALGTLEARRGNWEEVKTLFEEALQLYREMGDKQNVAVSLSNLGGVAQEQRDYSQAAALFLEALQLQRQQGDRRGIPKTLSHLGRVAIAQASYTEATAYFEESLELSRELGDRKQVMLTLRLLGDTNYFQGNFGQAKVRFIESLKMSQEMSEPRVSLDCLEALGWVSAAERQFILATRILAAAHTLRETTHIIKLSDNDREIHERVLALIRKELNPANFEAEWARGATASLEEAIILILSETAA